MLVWMGFFLLVWPQLVMRSGLPEPEPSSAESAIAEE